MRSQRIAKVVFILTSFFFLFSGVPEISRFLPGPEEALAAAPENAWWNANYGARKKITITAGTAITSGYSVSTTLNHAALVTAKQSLSSGNDVRIVYCNSCSGSSGWVELDRIIDPGSSWNNASTKIWFKTQADIAASGTDTNYYIYYSYPSAGTPPTTSTNVFIFHDNFESSDFEAWVGAWNGYGDSINIASVSVISANTGTGADGSRTISSGTTNIASIGGVSTAVTANPTGTQITVASTTGFAANDEIMLINQQGSSAPDTDDVGKYEFLKIASVAGNNLNLQSAVRRSYDGDNNFSNQKVMVQRVPQWTTVTIESGGTLTASAWNGTTGGIIAFRATGAVTINSGCSINANALGYRGGTGGGGTLGGNSGESYDGYVGSGGDDPTSGSGETRGSRGTGAGGSASNSVVGGVELVGVAGYRGGGGGGGNTDGNVTTDGAGGGGGGGYAGGGGGGGGGGDSTLPGSGGTGGAVGIGGGGGGMAGDNAAGGNGGNAGSDGAITGSQTVPAKVGGFQRTGQGGVGSDINSGGAGAGGGGGGGQYGFADLAMRICLGSGGGGGGDHDSGSLSGQSGGAGGGIIFIAANSVSNSGTISANGGVGTDTTDRRGAGGGGSGGSILIHAGSVTTNGATNFTAIGGSGGAASTSSSDPGGGGAGGGDGRIRIESGSITGTTNPTYYVTSGGQVHTGTYSAKCVSDTTSDWYGDEAGVNAMVVGDFTAQNTIYGTAYFYLSSTFDDMADTVTLMQSVNNDSWTNILSITLSTNKTLYVWNSHKSESYAKGSPTELARGTWHRIDWKFVRHATAGEAKVWLNGTLEIDATGKDTGDVEINRMTFGDAWQQNYTDPNTLYIDDTFVRPGISSEPSTALADPEGRYEYRKKLTIQYSEVGDSCTANLSNFPVLVKLSGDWLKTKAVDGTNGRIYNSNGYDICFRGADPETVLNYEIEKYDGTNGILVAWVKIPTVYYNQNTDFYIYYGNPGITSAPDASVARGVWSNNYEAVYHLNGNANDSTGNHNGSVSGATTSIDGKTLSSYEFNGSNQYIDANINKNWGCGGFTIEAWWSADNLYRDQVIVGASESSGATADISMVLSSQYIHQAHLITESGGGYGYIYDDAGWELCSGLAATTWYHSVLVRPYDSACKSTIHLYRDGNFIRYNNCWGYTNFDAAEFNIGRMGGTENKYFDGKIDEVRFSNVERDACWIETSFSTMNTPSAFIQEGTETRPTPTAVTMKSFKALQYGDGVLLKWKTSHEVNNLGFNVYREGNGELLRLTPELITGSALLAGSGTPLTAGHHYTWWDNSLTSDQLSAISDQQSTVRSQRSAVGGQRSVVRYYLEDVDLTGQRTFHGPVEALLPAPGSQLSASDFRRAELLSEFGMKLQEKYADFWKIQDFKEKLKEKNDRGASRLRRDSRSGLSGLEDRPSALRQKNFGLLTSSEALLKRSAPRGNLVPDPRANAVQRSLAGRPAMKLLVKEEGWYRVSQPELAAAGMNTHFNPKHLHLYADGNELPIRVIAEKENQFGPRDAIEFYGIGLDTPSTDARVYWLVVGSKPGKRINSHIFSPQFRNPHSAIRNSSESSQFRNPQSAIRNSLESFPYTAESKERSFYFPALLNGEESNFFGPIIYTYRVDQLLYVWDADMSSPEDALLEVALQGATAVPHRVKVFFNEAEVGEVSFMGQSQARFQAEIPVSALQAGENLVSFVAQGGEMDISMLEYIHLTYWRNYRAHENGLKLTAQGGRQVSVGGFSHARIQVLDITDPQSVVEVEGKVTKTQGSGYAITFRVPGSGSRTLLALGVEKAKSPAQLVLNQPSNWHQRGNGYDLVIISHKDFLESVKPLKNLREKQGYSVALVDVEDVYDEFSFGAKTPQAIKDFLQRAKSSWQKPPRFVLLVGDASYDPRNFLGYGDLDFVPTQLVDTAYLETASDDWLVDFDGDGLPDMAIGRLPVQTPQEASAMVAKIIAYEKSSRTNEVLLVADKTEKADDFDFVEAAQKVGVLFPSTVGVRKVFRGEFGSNSQAKEALLNYLGQGSLVVNYLGHGGMMEWRGDLFTADDADALPNAGKLPFFVNMTCLNGFFQAPYGDTLAESLLKAENGGAVAVWASSGMTEPAGQLKMNQELVRLLFSPEGLTIGEAAMKAKRAVNDKDIRRTWILFGDPATRLKP